MAHSSEGSGVLPADLFDPLFRALPELALLVRIPKQHQSGFGWPPYVRPCEGGHRVSGRWVHGNMAWPCESVVLGEELGGRLLRRLQHQTETGERT